MERPATVPIRGASVSEVGLVSRCIAIGTILGPAIAMSDRILSLRHVRKHSPGPIV